METIINEILEEASAEDLVDTALKLIGVASEKSGIGMEAIITAMLGFVKELEKPASKYLS